MEKNREVKKRFLQLVKSEKGTRYALNVPNSYGFFISDRMRTHRSHKSATKSDENNERKTEFDLKVYAKEWRQMSAREKEKYHEIERRQGSYPPINLRDIWENLPQYSALPSNISKRKNIFSLFLQDYIKMKRASGDQRGSVEMMKAAGGEWKLLSADQVEVYRQRAREYNNNNINLDRRDDPYKRIISRIVKQMKRLRKIKIVQGGGGGGGDKDSDEKLVQRIRGFNLFVAEEFKRRPQGFVDSCKYMIQCRDKWMADVSADRKLEYNNAAREMYKHLLNANSRQ
jgi:hypothetical protein